MQISGNQNGFGFFSAYKLAAAPQRPASSGEGNVAPAEKDTKIETERLGHDNDPHREGLLLQSAHRTAARAAEWTEALAEF